MFVTLDHHRGRASSGYQSVAVAVERTAGLLRLILTHGERLNPVERCHTVEVCLLRTATHDTILHPVTDQKIGQPHSMGTRSTCSRGRQVDAAQMEQASQIHRHGGVHRLEDGPTTASRCVFKLTELVKRTHGRFGHGVVSINDPDFVPVDIILLQMGMLKGRTRSHIGIPGFLRHELTQIP